jgi:hypothetical protein
LRFIEQRQAPVRLRQPIKTQQRAIARHDEICPSHVPRRHRLQPAGRHEGRVRHCQLQRRREAGRFQRPVGEKGGGGDQKRRRGSVALPQRQQQGEDLNGLAKPHVVGEAATKAELR